MKKQSLTALFSYLIIFGIGCTASRPKVQTQFLKNDDFTGIIEEDYYLPLSEGTDPQSQPQRSGIKYINAPNYTGPSIIGGMSAVNHTFEEVMGASDCPVKGRIFVSALIDATGKAHSPRITGSIHPDCDALALTAFERLQFTPAKIGVQTVAMPLTLPVNVL